MKKIRIEFKWALIFTAVSLAWMLLERIAGLHSTHIALHAVYTNFFAIVAIAVYVFALLDKRRNYYSGKMTYSQGFISGLIITFIVTLLTPLTQYITATLVTPDYFNNAIDYSVSQGNLTREAAEQYFSLNNYIIQSVIFAPIMGIITSAIVAIFTKTKA
jgi:hypothetical protein